jgi:hypothetical protein
VSDNEELNGLRTVFIDVLKKSFALYQQGMIAEVDLVAELSKNAPIFWDYRNIQDQQLNSAVSFSGSFFDAVHHGLDNVDGISMAEAGALVEMIINAFSKGTTIQDQRILSYYCGKKS